MKRNWITNINKGLQLAAEEKRETILFFSGDGWCHWCKQLKTYLEKNPTIDEFLDQNNFVKILVNIPRGEDDLSCTDAGCPLPQKGQYFGMRDKYRLLSIPTLIALDTQGNEFGRTEYLDDSSYLDWLQSLYLETHIHDSGSVGNPLAAKTSKVFNQGL
jgi:thioredoxin-related protein